MQEKTWQARGKKGGGGKKAEGKNACRKKRQQEKGERPTVRRSRVRTHVSHAMRELRRLGQARAGPGRRARAWTASRWPAEVGHACSARAGARGRPCKDREGTGPYPRWKKVNHAGQGRALHVRRRGQGAGKHPLRAMRSARGGMGPCDGPGGGARRGTGAWRSAIPFILSCFPRVDGRIPGQRLCRL